MTLSFVQTISVSSSPLVRDCVVDSINNEVWVVENSNSTVRVYNMGSGTQRGGNVTVTTNANNITFLSNASAVVYPSGGSNACTLIERSSLYAQTYTGSANGVVFTATKGQQAAGNPSQGISFSTSSTTGQIKKLRNVNTALNASDLTNLTPDWLGGTSAGNTTAFATTIITKGDNWLVGTSTGRVIEMDSTAKMLDSLDISDSFKGEVARANMAVPAVAGLSYFGNRLAVTLTVGMLLIYDWPTKTLLDKSVITGTTGASQGPVLCMAASGECLVSNGVSSGSGSEFNSIVMELDLQAKGDKIRNGLAFLNAVELCTASDINTTTSKAAIIQQTATNGSIHIFTITPPVRSNVDSRIEYPLNTPVEGRIIRLVDNVTSSSVEVDTTIKDQTTTIPVTPSEDFIEIAYYGSGVEERFDVSKYTSPSS